MKLQSPVPSDKTKVGCSSSTSRSWISRLHLPVQFFQGMQERSERKELWSKKQVHASSGASASHPNTSRKRTLPQKRVLPGQDGVAFLVKASFPVICRARLALLGLGMSWHDMECLSSVSVLGISLSQRTRAQNPLMLCPFFGSYSCSFCGWSWWWWHAAGARRGGGGCGSWCWCCWWC